MQVDQVRFARRHGRRDLRLPLLGSGSGKHVIPTMESRSSPATGTPRRWEALGFLSSGRDSLMGSPSIIDPILLSFGPAFESTRVTGGGAQVARRNEQLSVGREAHVAKLETARSSTGASRCQWPGGAAPTTTVVATAKMGVSFAASSSIRRPRRIATGQRSPAERLLRSARIARSALDGRAISRLY